MWLTRLEPRGPEAVVPVKKQTTSRKPASNPPSQEFPAFRLHAFYLARASS